MLRSPTIVTKQPFTVDLHANIKKNALNITRAKLLCQITIMPI